MFFGAHCFLLHPWFVAWAWVKLYGFPRSLPIWVSFFVHDLGYWGKPNMDGPEGETHVELGARILHNLFDSRCDCEFFGRPCDGDPCERSDKKWYHFSLCHSRHYSRKLNLPLSKLAAADKLAFCLEPRWLYLFRVKATGELKEYMDQIKWRGQNVGKFTPQEYSDLTSSDPRIWHRGLVSHTRRFVDGYMQGLREGMKVQEVS